LCDESIAVNQSTEAGGESLDNAQQRNNNNKNELLALVYTIIVDICISRGEFDNGCDQ
jgi:hypothetical protein